MDILEICPPKNLIFCIPSDLSRTLTITNLTLRSIFLYVVHSHPYELSISHKHVVMAPFEQFKLHMTFNFNQQIVNAALGKIRIYYFEVEDDENEDTFISKLFEETTKSQFEDINILFHLDAQSIKSLNYQQTIDSDERKYECVNPKISRKSYLMRRVYPPLGQSSKLKQGLGGEKLKHLIFDYLQKLKYVASIEERLPNATFLLESKQGTQDLCEFISFPFGSTQIIFVIERLISYGQSYTFPTLVNIDAEEDTLNQKTNINSGNNITSMKIIEKDNKVDTTKQTIIQKNPLPIVGQEKKEQVSTQLKKKDMTKQSFASRRQSGKVPKRRNRSEQKIQQESSQQQQADLRKQFKNLLYIEKPQKNIPQTAPLKIRRQIKINEINVELTEKVLTVYLELKEGKNFIYVILKDCVRIFIVEDPTYKRIIKFDAIDDDNLNMQTPVELYNDQLIFGNQSYLFWVHLTNEMSQWKYVQRKYIYSLSIIEQLSLVAVGGKNFSKLSYFGKQTSRSNIKLYSCSMSDKHDHLFTYDFPGNNVGSVMNMAYITTSPLSTKLLLVHTLSAENKSCFYFLRVKAFNKIEVFAQLQLDELGILSLLKFKYNKETSRIVCLETLGKTVVDTFKKLKVKCQYQKVEVSTEGFKFPLHRYISYHLGGTREAQNSQWMSLLQQKTCKCHLYDFVNNKLETINVAPDVKQVFYLNNGKHLLTCSSTSFKITEKIELQIRE